ncbi:hypothetical protein BDV93DRAFT_517694 [Ceratobasidium sp. AG-I]|nr:hypothetical protein BDV93DRAFT_517694 [Ceratobasidium sp. AG-I]
MPEIPSEPVVTLFEPAPGGDMTLRSSDGVTFGVHSILMGLASSVFKDMLSVGAKNDEIIELAEDSKLISLMLEFIYPTKTPMIASLAVFEQALQIAQKYDIKGMLDILDGQLCLGAKNELVAADPLRACILAYSFGLMKAAEITARVVDLKVNLRTPSGIVMLKKLPVNSELLMRLIGMQAMRAEVLADILFTYDDSPMNDYIATDIGFPYCFKCRKEPIYTKPMWMIRWSKSVYRLALTCDLQDLPHDLKIDNVNSITRLVDYHENSDLFPATCLGCVSFVRAMEEEYSEWAGGVAEEIKDRLSHLHSQLSLFPM